MRVRSARTPWKSLRSSGPRLLSGSSAHSGRAQHANVARLRARFCRRRAIASFVIPITQPSPAARYKPDMQSTRCAEPTQKPLERTMNTTRTFLALAAVAALGTTLISTAADARGFGGGFHGGGARMGGAPRMAAPRANFGGMRTGGFRPNFAFRGANHSM